MRYQPKYAELQDKSWLEQKYTEEQLSSTAIGKIVGCHRTSVTVALRRHSIDRRGRKAARKLVPLQSFKYDLLNDKDFLLQKYMIEGLSTENVAQLAKAKTPNSARQALLRFGIHVRDSREGQIHSRTEDGFVLSKYVQEVVEGGLLGDAHLKIHNKNSEICAPAFQRRNKFYDHVEFVCEQIGCDSSKIKREERVFPIYHFATLTHDCLIPIYRKWYPAENNYVKIVPQDLVLTPVTLLHWFLDDGTSSWRNRKYPKGWKQRKEQVVLRLCSESFTKEDNQFLRDQMKTLFDISCSVTVAAAGTGWRVTVRQSAVPAFFEVIGPCPVPSLAYKWKIPGSKA